MLGLKLPLNEVIPDVIGFVLEGIDIVSVAVVSITIDGDSCC